MAYEPPTVEQFKARFPGFDNVPDETVEAALTEAARMVDTSWLEPDFAPARMYYAAHVLVLDGNGDSKEAKIAGLTLAGLSSIKISSLAVGFKRAGSEGNQQYASALQSTSYGTRFLGLLKLNKPAVVMAVGYDGLS